jgi:xanthine dehydrogenase FAD-binding subunit
MASIRYEAPADLDALARCLAASGPDTCLLGGGTDLLPRFHGRIPAGTALIDLRSVQGLDRIEHLEGEIQLGANVTYTRLSEDPSIRRQLACLAEMASGVGSIQIRNAACLPGNLANASPGGDAIGTLLALDAQVLVLDSGGARRTVAIPELVLGIGRTSLARDEAIIGIRIPVPASPRNGFGKLGLGARREVVIANVSLTMVFDFREAEGVIAGARIVVGSAAPRAYRSPEAEDLCTGRPPSAALARELSDCLTRVVRASIGQNPLFAHKPSDVQGLALDVFQHIFADRI